MSCRHDDTKASAKERSAAFEIVVLSVSEAAAVDPIPSGYTTSRAYELQRRQHDAGVTWELGIRDLHRTFIKQYDDGKVSSMLESYADTTRPNDVTFLAARRDGRIAGMLAYQWLRWNDALWLIDIRVREHDRRSGAGTELVQALQFSCGLRGHRGISVETQFSNYPAIQFYLRQGFHVVGFNEMLYTNHDLSDQDVACFLFWPAHE